MGITNFVDLRGLVMGEPAVNKVKVIGACVRREKLSEKEFLGQPTGTFPYKFDVFASTGLKLGSNSLGMNWSSGHSHPAPSVLEVQSLWQASEPVKSLRLVGNETYDLEAELAKCELRLKESQAREAAGSQRLNEVLKQNILLRRQLARAVHSRIQQFEYYSKLRFRAVEWAVRRLKSSPVLARVCRSGARLATKTWRRLRQLKSLLRR